MSLLLTLRLTLASTSREGAEPCGGDVRPLYTCDGADGWMDDKGIRRTKRWGIRVGELGRDYGDLRIRSEGVT